MLLFHSPTPLQAESTHFPVLSKVEEWKKKGKLIPLQQLNPRGGVRWTPEAGDLWVPFNYLPLPLRVEGHHCPLPTTSAPLPPSEIHRHMISKQDRKGNLERVSVSPNPGPHQNWLLNKSRWRTEGRKSHKERAKVPSAPNFPSPITSPSPSRLLCLHFGNMSHSRNFSEPQFLISSTLENPRYKKGERGKEHPHLFSRL